MGFGSRIKAGNLFGGSAIGKFLNSATLQTLTANKVGHALHGDSLGETLHNEGEANPWKAYNNAKMNEAYEPYQKEQERQWRIQNGIDNSVTGIRAQFGLFDGDATANPGQAAYAKEQAAKINQSHDTYHQAYLDYFGPQLDNQFHGAMTKANWAGVNKGTSGGSADAVRERPVLDNYLEGQRKITAGADAGVQNLMDEETQSRNDLVAQARNGLAPEDAVNDSLAGLANAYTSANSQIHNQTLGDVFSTGGNLYSGYQSDVGATQGRNRANVGLFDGHGADSNGSYT